MTLDEWLKSVGMINAECGRRLGCTGMAVCRYRYGSRMPRPDMVAKIERLTGGLVKYADLARAYRRAQTKLTRARAA